MGSNLEPQLIEGIKKANEMLHQANEHIYYLWQNYMLFTWRWWLGVLLTIVPWVIWLFIRKKESTDRLLYIAFYVMLISSLFDILGMAMGLWAYPSKVIPLIPSFIPWDLTLLPIATIIFIQYKSNFNPIIKSVIFSAIGSFIVQPFFQWVELYDPMKWKHYYSFPILIAIYLVAHYFSQRTQFDKI